MDSRPSTQRSNPGLLHFRQTLYHLSHQGSPSSEGYPKVNTPRQCSLDQSAGMQLLQERLWNKSPHPTYVLNYCEVNLGHSACNQVALWAIKELFLIVQYSFHSDTRKKSLHSLNPTVQALGPYTCRRFQHLPLVRQECYGVLFNFFVHFIFIY